MKFFPGKILITGFVFFLSACGAKEIVIKRGGISYDTEKKVVVSYQDLRKWYDQRDYDRIYDTLSPVIDNGGIDNYFVHYILIEAAYQEKETGNIQEYYLKSHLKHFYQGATAFHQERYGIALDYFKLIKTKDPVVHYLIGTCYLFRKEYPLAQAHLRLAQNWENAPWPYLNMASLMEIRKEYDASLKYLDQAMDYTYDFEKNLMTDILIRKTDIYFQRRNYQEAYFYSDRAYQEDPQKTLTYSDPGDILLAWGKQAQAKSFWNEALQNLNLSNDLQTLIRNKIEIVEMLKEK
jgi:predicted negative regulator of RcsB-dependent stress response